MPPESLQKFYYQPLPTGRQKMKVYGWKTVISIVKEIIVDSGRMLKRVQPAPQGRATVLKNVQIMLLLSLTANSE